MPPSLSITIWIRFSLKMSTNFTRNIFEIYLAAQISSIFLKIIFFFNFSTHMQDMQDVTQEVHYENYRSERLAKGAPIPKRTT